MLVFSCHADTGFDRHALERRADGVLYGHLDNFTGVYAVMSAYFSGRLNRDYLRIELTYGEEVDFAGALEVRETLRPHDVVFVVDVTGTPTKGDLVIEKCESPELRRFLETVLAGMAVDIYPDCPDPVSDEDETDVYREAVRFTCFLGVPCFGGDYNDGRVCCRDASLAAMAEAICRIAEGFPAFCRETGIASE